MVGLGLSFLNSVLDLDHKIRQSAHHWWQSNACSMLSSDVKIFWRHWNWINLAVVRHELFDLTVSIFRGQNWFNSVNNFF